MFRMKRILWAVPLCVALLLGAALGEGALPE